MARSWFDENQPDDGSYQLPGQPMATTDPLVQETQQPSQPAQGPINDEQWIDQKIQQYGIDPQEKPYWMNLAREHGGVQNLGEGWLDDRMMRADSAAGVRSGQVQRAGGGSSGGSFSNWYGGAGGFGSAPPEYRTPDLPAWLTGPFTLDKFTMPTAEEFESSPGFKFGIGQAQQGLERSAAAKGSVLSGGFQKALAKYLNDYATTGYGNFVNQALGINQANNQVSLAGRQQNVNEYQNQVANAYNQYGTNYNTKRNAENDYWSRLRDQSQLGASSATQVRA